MTDNERQELIFKYAIGKASALTEDDLRGIYLENMTDWLETWDDDELLELSGHLPMGEL